MKPKVLIVLLLSFAISTAGAKKDTAAVEFISSESGICKINLHNYELTKPAERAIVFGVGKIVDTYKDTFGFSYPDNFKVTITIFSNKDEFLEYQRKRIGKIVSESGYYDFGHRETVVLNEKNTKKTKDAKEMVGLVFHEANHLILRYHIPWVPSWVNEGLSEYFEGLNVFGENRRVYLQENRIKWCKYWIKKGFPIKLEDYISLSYDEWMSFRKRDSNAAYTIGYSLVYFMMSRSSTEKILKELLWDFRRHEKGANSIETINKHYPGGFEKFKRNWLKWIPKARSYRPLRSLRKKAEKAKKDASTDNQSSKNKK